jgi:hypothetical protein
MVLLSEFDPRTKGYFMLPRCDVRDAKKASCTPAERNAAHQKQTMLTHMGVDAKGLVAQAVDVKVDQFYICRTHFHPALRDLFIVTGSGVKLPKTVPLHVQETLGLTARDLLLDQSGFTAVPTWKISDIEQELTVKRAAAHRCDVFWCHVQGACVWGGGGG